MKYIDFGRVIRALRGKYGWTQEQTAVKLGCSASYVSKIENGAVVPPFSMMEYAFQKLGEDSQDYMAFFLDGDEKFGYLTMKRLGNLHIQENYTEMRRLIGEAEGRKPFTSGIFLQYLLFCKTAADKDLAPQERLDRLTEAIRITEKDFKEEMVGSSVFSYNEIIIISGIADAYHQLGDSQKAVQMMYGLKESMDMGYIDEWEKSRTYPMVLYNLSVYLGALDRDDEMYDVCVEAKKYAVRYNNMRVLPKVLGTIAHYKFLKGDYIGMKDILYQAYFTARGMEQYSMANLIAQVAKERYNIDLNTVFSLL